MKMIYYSAYIQLTQQKVLGLVINDKDKNKTVIVDSFEFPIFDYINDKGTIQYPLQLVDEIEKHLNTDSFSVKDVSLIISPKDCQINCNQENALLNAKDISDFAKNKIENTFKKPTEAYEIGWLHTGNILDDGAPFSIFLQYCYSLREIKKLTKAFQKNKIHIKEVILPELATIALYEQYISEYSDPNTVIIESGYSAQPTSNTNIFSYKRNVFENLNTFKIGLNTILVEIQGAFSKFSIGQIYDLLISCGAFADYKTEDALIILDMNDINIDEWYAVCTRAFHTFFTSIRNDITRRSEKIDNIVLVGGLGKIPKINEYLYSNYALVTTIWENEYELVIGQESIITNSEEKLNSEFATLFGAIYYKHWTKRIKNGSLSTKTVEINLDRYKRYAFIFLGAAVVFSLTVFGPEFYKNYKLTEEYKLKQEEVASVSHIQANIERYKNTIEAQEDFLERSKIPVFNMKEFMYSATLLKPKDVTLISIDTPNFLETPKVDTGEFYYIKKAVQKKMYDNGSTDIDLKNTKIQEIDITGKDWTFGLDWEGVELTPQGIKRHLDANGIVNVNKFLVSKIVIRGYGSQTSIATYAKDLEDINGIYRVDIVSSEKRKVPNNSGVTKEVSVFELNVWAGEGGNN